MRINAALKLKRPFARVGGFILGVHLRLVIGVGVETLLRIHMP